MHYKVLWQDGCWFKNLVVSYSAKGVLKIDKIPSKSYVVKKKSNAFIIADSTGQPGIHDHETQIKVLLSVIKQTLKNERRTHFESQLAKINPKQQPGDYVFCTIPATATIDLPVTIGWFRGKEGITIIVEEQRENECKLPYSFVSGWISLSIQPSPEAVGLTTAVAAAHAKGYI